MSQENQIRGLKSTLHNPRVSDEAKQSAQERLDNMGAGNLNKSSQNSSEPSQRTSGDSSSNQDPVDERIREGKGEGNILRGYKASMHNPNVSDEAKEHSRQILEEHGAL